MERTVFAGLALAVLIILSGCNRNADRHIQKGLSHLGEQDYNAAVSHLSRAIAINSKAATKHNITARTRGPRYRKRFGSNNQREDRPRYRDIDYDMEDATVAGAEILKAKKHNSDNAVAYFYRGTARFYLHDNEGAIADFSSAIIIDSTYSCAYCSRGVAKMELGLEESGMQDICRAAEYGDTLALELKSKYLKQEQIP